MGVETEEITVLTKQITSENLISPTKYFKVNTYSMELLSPSVVFIIELYLDLASGFLMLVEIFPELRKSKLSLFLFVLLLECRGITSGIVEQNQKLNLYSLQFDHLFNNKWTLVFQNDKIIF